MLFGLSVVFRPVTDRLITEMTIQATDASNSDTLTDLKPGQRRALISWLTSGNQFNLKISKGCGSPPAKRTRARSIT
jgi:hypothetical protein